MSYPHVNFTFGNHVLLPVSSILSLTWATLVPCRQSISISLAYYKNLNSNFCFCNEPTTVAVCRTYN